LLHQPLLASPPLLSLTLLSSRLLSYSPLLSSPFCLVSQLSKGKTQCPFTRTPGTVQSISFHPSRPFLFVATQTAVKVYHLIEQRMVKKLMSGCKWISSIDMHPSGDHVIIGSYDRRCASSLCPYLPCPALPCHESLP
jgi:WD40 repeat protein